MWSERATHPEEAAGESDGARRRAWLGLLVELTASRRDWLAWKGYESALAGTGDVDSVAPGGGVAIDHWDIRLLGSHAWSGPRRGLPPRTRTPSHDRAARRGRRLLPCEEPEGVREVAALFGRGSGAVTRGALAVTAGRWDRAAMLAVEARSLARATLEPDAVAWRLRFRWHKRRCPVLRSVFEGGRLVPHEEQAAWIEQVVAYGSHEVIYPGASH